MKYVRVYDPLFDESFQCEIDDETAIKAIAACKQIYDKPIKNLPIMSRLRSERHPGWAD